MKKQMKKMGSIVLMVALVFVLAACSSGNGGGETAEETMPGDSGTLGAYEVAIKDYALVSDYEGNDAIAIYYDFTNNGEDAASFDVACMYTVFQGGVELEYTSVYKDEANFEMMGDSTMTEIQPGTTLEVISTHKLNDTAGSVDVEVEEFLGGSGKVVKTFEITE